jgi:hypothetical protein
MSEPTSIRAAVESMTDEDCLEFIRQCRAIYRGYSVAEVPAALRQYVVDALTPSAPPQSA